MKKLLIFVVALVLASFATVAGGGHATAAPIPQLSTTGNNFGTFGDHSFCRGAVNIGLDAPAGKPGVVRVTARSHGFTGDGPGWRKNPRCRVLFATTYTSGRGLNIQKWVRAGFGPRHGESKTWDVHTGSGVVVFGVTAYSTNSPIASPQSYGAGFYLLVP